MAPASRCSLQLYLLLGLQDHRFPYDLFICFSVLSLPRPPHFSPQSPPRTNLSLSSLLSLLPLPLYIPISSPIIQPTCHQRTRLCFIWGGLRLCRFGVWWSPGVKPSEYGGVIVFYFLSLEIHFSKGHGSNLGFLAIVSLLTLDHAEMYVFFLLNV